MLRQRTSGHVSPIIQLDKWESGSEVKIIYISTGASMVKSHAVANSHNEISCLKKYSNRVKTNDLTPRTLGK